MTSFETDIIKLLPDNIANQIAAGEVIQRPASAVKELLENAIDAEATTIHLLVKDAGKALVQVIDNGKGMSQTDARMAFERHATSKIAHVNDLFNLQTMGFRGEALASIAAVAAVELKTKRASDEVGTVLEIENSLVTKQDAIAMETGTHIAMKNLFFNVPARRNFLKSNATELKQILDEFSRIALAYPEIVFTLTHNNQQIYQLEKGSLKQRIVQLLGTSYQSKLIPVKEDANGINIIGYVGKPDTAKKTRGDQFLFVNNRFIKSPYLNHAVNTAFATLVPKDSFATYILFIDVNPATIDVNVHPSKQEIKFDDERLIYAFVNSAVKQALTQNHIVPSLDFELDVNIQQADAVAKPFDEVKQQQVLDSNLHQGFRQKNQAHFIEKSSSNFNANWQSFFETPNTSLSQKHTTENQLRFTHQLIVDTPSDAENYYKHIQAEALVQLLTTYIIAPLENGFLLIHQQNAHERVVYNRLRKSVRSQPQASQALLFPAVVTLSTADATLLHELLPLLQKTGFEVETFGGNSFIIKALPAYLHLQGAEQQIIEQFVEQYKHFSLNIKLDEEEKLLRTLAMQGSMKPNTSLPLVEMQQLLKELWQEPFAAITPGGKPVFEYFDGNELRKKFGR